jgi:hypothetical protein
LESKESRRENAGFSYLGKMTKRSLGLEAARGVRYEMSLPPAASVESWLEIPEGRCVISYTLNTQEIIQSVQDDRAGATAVFIGMESLQEIETSRADWREGTTRNSFKGSPKYLRPRSVNNNLSRQNCNTARIPGVHKARAENNSQCRTQCC